VSAPAAPLLTVQQVAALYGYSIAHLYVMVRQGKIPARRVGRSIRFVPAELDAWTAALPKAGN
jgi:excisionase family DNA binding protein